MYTIATLNDLGRQLQLTDSDAETDDMLLRALGEASLLIESLTQRRYCPRVESRLIALDATAPRELFLPDDLLELHSISDGGGAIDLAQIRRLPAHPDAPASMLQRLDDVAFRHSLSAAEAVRVKGIWGWHDRWTAAWRDSGDTVRDNPLTAGATEIAVSDIDGADGDGLRPRFQVGQLLRIDDEYLRLTAVDAATRRLTAQRGVQGTAATAHARGDKIESYAPAAAIRDLTLRYAALLVKSVGPLDAAPSPLLESLRRLTA